MSLGASNAHCVMLPYSNVTHSSEAIAAALRMCSKIQWLYCICLLYASAGTLCDFSYLFGVASRLQIPEWKSLRLPAHANTQGKFSLSLVAYSKEHSDSSVWPETTQFSRQPGCSCEQRCYCSFQSYHIASCTYSLLIIAPVDCWRTSTLEENGKCDSYAHWLQHVEQHKQPTKTTTECVLTATVALNSCLHCGNDAS